MMTDRSINVAAVIVLNAGKTGNVLMIAGIVVVIALIALKTGNVLVIVVDMAKIATKVAKIATVIVPHSKIQNPRK